MQSYITLALPLDHLKRIHPKTLRLACRLKIFIRTLPKELIRSGPVGPGSDITSKSGFFLLVLVNVREAKKVSTT
jgi:hypothetical protein